MLYRATILSSVAATNGDVHLSVKVQSKYKNAWKLVPGGIITVILDRHSLLETIISGAPLAQRKSALNDLLIQSIQAWQLDADIGANNSLNEAFTNLLGKDFPFNVDLP
jgi:hypothetical protein